MGVLRDTFGIAPRGDRIRTRGRKITDTWGRNFSAELRKAKEASQGRTYWRRVTMALAMSPSWRSSSPAGRVATETGQDPA